jgi:hypothetical protein
MDDESKPLPHPPAPDTFTAKTSSTEWSFTGWIRLIRWSIGGVLCLALGLWLMVDPDMRRNPAAFTVVDLLRGLGACLVGLFMLAFSYWAIRSRPDRHG